MARTVKSELGEGLRECRAYRETDPSAGLHALAREVRPGSSPGQALSRKRRGAAACHGNYAAAASVPGALRTIVKRTLQRWRFSSESARHACCAASRLAN